MIATLQQIDWTAVALAFVIVTGCLLPWIALRNIELPNMLSRIVHEESDWLEQHQGCYKGNFVRYETLPSYGRILLTLWKPLKEFEDELKPVAEYYKEK